MTKTNPILSRLSISVNTENINPEDVKDLIAEIITIFDQFDLKCYTFTNNSKDVKDPYNKSNE